LIDKIKRQTCYAYSGPEGAQQYLEIIQKWDGNNTVGAITFEHRKIGTASHYFRRNYVLEILLTLLRCT